MDILIELFLEFLIEGTAKTAESKKTPKLTRLLALALIMGMMLFLFFMAYINRTEKEMMWTFIVFGSLIAFFLLNLLYDYVKMKNA